MGEGRDERLYHSLAIPSYEEATSSRRASSESRCGPEEVSDDAERQGLLRLPPRIDPPQNAGYRPPTVESARSSLDFLPSTDPSERGSTENLRREIQQLEVDDTNVDAHIHRSQLANRFSKSFNSLTSSLSSLNLPFRRYVPSWPPFSQVRFGSWTNFEHDRLILLGRMFGAALFIGLVYLLIASDFLSFGPNRPFGQVYDPESIRMFAQSRMNQEGNIQENLEFLTRDAHLAGTKGSRFYANWVKGLFKSASLEDVGLERFDVYLNWPTKDGRRVAIVEPPEKVWEAPLEENASGGNRQQTYSPVFHGHSKAGDVTGHLVYANYGSRYDFEWLEEKGIPLSGAIVLVRYGGSQADPGLKVKAAELAGAAGCIIYADLQAEGDPWPNGRHMPSDGVERGAVSLASWVIGDVLSPGWASTPEEERRLPTEESPGLVKIPSIPISWRNAERLLQALQGQGKEAPEEWRGGPMSTGYWTGSQNSPKVNLKNLQDEVAREPVYNVLGRISGWEQSEKKVIVGNRRDAWCVGAADPGSGTAILLELVQVFGQLRKLGWKPLRTIEFASWDGEEYNLIGSTEHVENRLDELRRDGVAYINVDVGVSGGEFWAAASPLYEQALLRVLDRTTEPTTNKTLREVWDVRNARLEELGSRSGYAAPQAMAGISSIDLGFRGKSYPDHSCYDSYAWMTHFGDPNFEYHTVMGQVWALLVLEVADQPILPFDMTGYARHLETYVTKLDEYAHAKRGNVQSAAPLNLAALYGHASGFGTQAHRFHEWGRAWKELVYSSGGVESNVMAIKRMSHNNRMANFETHLLDLEHDLDDRTQFKHVLFGPQKWAANDGAPFPLIRDAIDAGDWDAAQKEVDTVADILGRAIHKLNHN